MAGTVAAERRCYLMTLMPGGKIVIEILGMRRTSEAWPMSAEGRDGAPAVALVKIAAGVTTGHPHPSMPTGRYCEQLPPPQRRREFTMKARPLRTWLSDDHFCHEQSS
jgi:hypothetical protein